MLSNITINAQTFTFLINSEIIENVRKHLPGYSGKDVYKLIMPHVVKFIDNTTLDEMEITYLGKLVPNRSLYYLTHEQFAELQNAVNNAEIIESQTYEGDHVIQKSNN